MYDVALNRVFSVFTPSINNIFVVMRLMDIYFFMLFHVTKVNWWQNY